MSPLRIVAIVFIVGGILGLVYGGFSYVSDSHDLNLGVANVSLKEREHVNVPVWVGVAGIAVGAALLFGRK